MMRWTSATAVRRVSVARASGELGATSPIGAPQAWAALARSTTVKAATITSRCTRLILPRRQMRRPICKQMGRVTVEIGSVRYTIANDFTSPRCGRTHSVPSGVCRRPASRTRLMSTAKPSTQNGSRQENGGITGAFRTRVAPAVSARRSGACSPSRPGSFGGLRGYRKCERWRPARGVDGSCAAVRSRRAEWPKAARTTFGGAARNGLSPFRQNVNPCFQLCEASEGAAIRLL